MLVYGKNVAREILNSEITIKKIYLLETFNNEEIKKLIQKRKIETTQTSQNEMSKMTTEPHQGIIIEIEDYKFLEFETIKNDKNANFIVVLDHIEDPRNFGAIIRTCECAGVDYIIIPNKGASEITASVVKTSSGALANMKIVQVSNLRNALNNLKKLEFWIIGTDANGEDYKKIDYKGKTALVIGSEGNGLKHIIKETCDIVASIPIKGKVNSLNASVAAGIMIYEVVKWR
ncbi:MAG: 23S rRNA (guanosine(2251)-2'-O)-methyltransferase RlmB [Bacilli bacterium]|nr:23S rRNA (guanosine(2251)-2'-O)-methyltransferase RlmB [Bacilli bacterium]